MSSASNPGQALGTPNVYGGKTSIEGFSDGIAHAFSYGFVSGFRARANGPLGMSILVGGETNDDNNPIKDVVIVKNDSTDDRYVVFNKSNAPIEVTIPTAPTVNSRIDAVVVYRDMAATGDSDTTDNPSSVGIAVVEGTVAADPSYPSPTQIRAAIPNGTQACYTTICRVKVSAGVTTISDSNITDARQHSYLNNNVVFPVGYIFISTSSINPSEFFGGKWKRIANGRMLIGVDEADNDFNESNKTGGEKSHRLFINEMPSHTHTLNRDMNTWDGSKVGYDFNYGHGTGAPVGAGSNVLNNTGGGAPHNNMPPYYTVYMWERTA